MECPNCSSSVTETTLLCKCGHEFVKQEKQSEEPSQKIYRMFFYGDAGTLFSIHIVNLFLTILTLGVYYFWGKVKVRKYLYGQTEFEGDRFTYHGTGKELLVGWLKAVLGIGLFIAANVAITSYWKGAIVEAVATALLYLCILILMPIAIVYSQRYWLSRTSWRGIRFSFRGGVKDFIKIYIPGVLLTLISLGVYYPYFQNDIRKFQINHTYFGSTRFSYDGKGSDILGRHILALLLSILTLGLYWFWFAAWRHRYYWEHTSFSTTRFRSTITGGPLLRLKLGNLLLLILTLGLAWPWTVVRNARFMLSRITLEGPYKNLSGCPSRFLDRRRSDRTARY
jgi:uncharacterized membrane protein YjgN (DUF898 family)